MDTCVGFADGLADHDTGLIHFGYREYDPAIGRLITPDPIGLAGGDVDVCGYCLNDPIICRFFVTFFRIAIDTLFIISYQVNQSDRKTLSIHVQSMAT
ncbi:RHS repeat-associated core domain-containing protein [Maridesulfovibrio frigidus]|uniref:RHS repeat-associated core domain-containing protein n=1 Tax=Maridesulfovibrio frigidus TaxID=340956 RepID=UPI000A04DDD3